MTNKVQFVEPTGEEPYVRDHYKQVLEKEGVEFTMPDYVFDPNYRPSKEEALVSQI